MTMYILSFTGDYADESFSTTLEGTEYKIRLKWNTYDEAWRISIGYSGQSATRTRKVLCCTDLIQYDHHLDGIPPGEMYMFDFLKTYGRPTRDDSGQSKRFQLIYITSDDEA